MTTLISVPATVPSAYQPDLSPVADSLALSALIALLPLVTVFVTLGVLKWKAHWAGLSAVLVAIIVAAVFFGMPVQLAALAATQGAAWSARPRATAGPGSPVTSRRAAARAPTPASRSATARRG